jgi:hypothetical protein
VLLDPLVILIITAIPVYIVVFVILKPMGDPWSLGGVIIGTIWLSIAVIYLVSVLVYNWKNRAT